MAKSPVFKSTFESYVTASTVVYGALKRLPCFGALDIIIALLLLLLFHGKWQSEDKVSDAGQMLAWRSVLRAVRVWSPENGELAYYCSIASVDCMWRYCALFVSRADQIAFYTDIDSTPVIQAARRKSITVDTVTAAIYVLLVCVCRLAMYS